VLLVEFYGNVNAQPFRTVTERHHDVDVCFCLRHSAYSQYESKTSVGTLLANFSLTKQNLDLSMEGCRRE